MPDIDRNEAEAVLYRVATVAFSHEAVVGTLDRDALHAEVAWCLEPLEGISADNLTWLRAAIAAAIVDPTSHRQRLRSALGGTRIR
ncbi:MAG: hypothetical protein K0Q52_84 [Microbacterium sp.]|nr:hypothetical protein [Microbacterium sp.]